MLEDFLCCFRCRLRSRRDLGQLVGDFRYFFLLRLQICTNQLQFLVYNCFHLLLEVIARVLVEDLDPNLEEFFDPFRNLIIC